MKSLARVKAEPLCLGCSHFYEHMKKPKKESSSPSSSSSEEEKEVPKKPPKLYTDELPEDLAKFVDDIQEQLEKGELDDAMISLIQIKNVLDDSDRFAVGKPVDLSFEF